MFRYTLMIGLALSAATTASLSGEPLAQADDGAQGFVERQHGRLSALLRQPASGARDAQINTELDGMVDYALLAQRTFGEPCPASVSDCQNHWKDLSDAQKREVTDLLKQLVQKNYRKNLMKTLDYDMTFRASTAVGSDSKVRTIAKSRVNAREAPVSIDYLVTNSGGNLRVVDIVTEGSSLAKNYYGQFHKMLTTPEQGYAHVVKRLRDKIAAK
jgi:ABC-type transporter MlaC component